MFWFVKVDFASLAASAILDDSAILAVRRISGFLAGFLTSCCSVDSKLSVATLLLGRLCISGCLALPYCSLRKLVCCCYCAAFVCCC
ncbi:hypothetical protein OWV82_010501 [Melia azedarach]|uniref:Uncharacterized protein n=1 Tax=Melia azedarach TaxID=155640 RepID=A0ACC1Y5B1_MELAZ|nr:hypothetical protein OWV82_010501 [Melia azedarach]